MLELSACEAQPARSIPSTTLPATRLGSAACVCNVQRPSALRQQQEPVSRAANRCAQPPRRGCWGASKGFNTSSRMGSLALQWFDLAGDLAHSKAVHLLPGSCFNPHPPGVEKLWAPTASHSLCPRVSGARALAACKSGFWCQQNAEECCRFLFIFFFPYCHFC